MHHSSTGIFTAPANGTYLFTFSLFINSANTTTQARYLKEMVNGVSNYLIFNQNYPISEGMITITTHHYLTTGQTKPIIMSMMVEAI